jgi:dTDP-4-dehydrorhamnose 3,5-epimerase
MGWALYGSNSQSENSPVKFTAIPLPGAYLVELEPMGDARGFFARSWCAEEFCAHGLNSRLAQCSLSFNHTKGTLRGMHYQDEPYPEAKLVRCSSGAICDVILDLRPASSAYAKWYAVELTAANRKMLYVPEGFAHGFQTLADNSEVLYQISETYRPGCARGVRWNDPQFAIVWPLQNPIMSERDRTFADHQPCTKC